MKMSRSLSFGFYILCVLMLASAAFGQRTTRHKLRPATAASAADASADMVQLDTIVAPEPRMLGVNGYDKPLRSRRETFFVTNNSDAELASIAFTITYYDTSRRIPDCGCQ